MKPTVNPIFAVPFAETQMSDCDALNESLRRLILSRERMGSTYANPNPSLAQQAGVFESDFDFFASTEDCVQTLRRFCWSALGHAIVDTNGYNPPDLNRLQIFSHTWFHVTRTGGFTVLHTHPMASWSGVYCVTSGDVDPTRPESAVLKFHNPHHYSNYFLDAGNAKLKPPYHHGTWNMRLAPGQLVLFPSWLQHEVMPYFGVTERITVAFNCWFNMKQ